MWHYTNIIIFSVIILAIIICSGEEVLHSRWRNESKMRSRRRDVSTQPRHQQSVGEEGQVIHQRT